MLDDTCMSCDNGGRYFDSRCFKLFDKGDGFQTYSAAQSLCVNNNGYLAILNTKAKFDFVKSIISYSQSYFVI